MKSAWILLGALVFGCSDGDPLGGAHGGTGDPFGPNAANPPADNNGNGDGTGTGDPMSGADAGSGTQSDSGSMGSKDSGSQQMQGQDSGSQMQPQAPTWTQIFNAYLATSTTGNCGHCHSSCSSKSGCYTWLQGKGYISGANSALVDSNSSCLSWYGGNMPPSGPSSYAKATADMNAWAKAGGLNN